MLLNLKRTFNELQGQMNMQLRTSNSADSYVREQAVADRQAVRMATAPQPHGQVVASPEKAVWESFSITADSPTGDETTPFVQINSGTVSEPLEGSIVLGIRRTM